MKKLPARESKAEKYEDLTTPRRNQWLGRCGHGAGIFFLGASTDGTAVGHMPSLGSQLFLSSHLSGNGLNECSPEASTSDSIVI